MSSRARRRRWATWGLGVLAGLLTAAMATPVVLLDVGRRKAETCIARIEAPRTAELPRCEAIASWFTIPLVAPWTSRWAAIYQEELLARMAIARYVDAAVGQPDRAALAQHLDGVQRSAKALRAGTGRLRLAQLGRAIPAPEVGELAFRVGHRDALTQRGLDWTQWYTSSRAMEAALLHNDLRRAIRLAEHYAGRPDSDLRLQVGALLCIGDDPERGLEQVLPVEETRAAERNANTARDFGSARVLIEACASRAGTEPPPVPVYGNAGQWDHRERLSVLRLRRALHAAGCADARKLEPCMTAEPVAKAAGNAVNLLSSGIGLDYRLELVAAVAPFVRDGVAAAELTRPLDGEPSVLARVPLTLRPMVERDSVAQPFVHPSTLDAAADHLVGLQPSRAENRVLAGAMLARAAAGYAALGQAAAALDCAKRASPLALDDPLAGALLLSSVAFLAAEEDTATASLVAALEEPREADAIVAAARIQLAQLLALRHSHDAALGEARRAVAAARTAKLPALEERAAWVLLALEGPALADADRDGADSSPILQLPAVGPPMGWVSPAARRNQVSAAHQVWRQWLRASGPARLAHRYAAFRSRGDAPEARVAHLVCAGLLADEPSQVEPWLDAFYALDSGKIRLRGYAWARSQAARWRGDADAARTWLERYRALEAWAQNGLTAELFQELRL